MKDIAVGRSAVGRDTHHRRRVVVPIAEVQLDESQVSVSLHKFYSNDVVYVLMCCVVFP